MSLTNYLWTGTGTSIINPAATQTQALQNIVGVQGRFNNVRA